MQVVKGAFDGLTGRMTDVSLGGAPAQKGPEAPKSRTAALTDIDTADIKFGYCTEFIINLDKEYSDQDEIQLKSYLESTCGGVG